MDGGKAEHVKEAAAVVSQYCNIIGIRTFAGLTDKEADYQEVVLNNFVKYCQVPVISLESATLHPLQSLADMLTISEHQKSTKPKIVLTWAPHPRALPQAVANSFLQWASRWDCDLVVTHPEGYELAEEFAQGATLIRDQNEAFEGADFIYAKNWSSYNHYGKILSTDSSWMVTEQRCRLPTRDILCIVCQLEET